MHLRDVNRLHLNATGDSEIASRIESYELAFRMQSAAPGLLDFPGRPPLPGRCTASTRNETRAFGTKLPARATHGRSAAWRFVQLFHSTWDDHSDLNRMLKINCDMTDQPAAALVRDLKQRGLLDDTLVVWAGEFWPHAHGRDPSRVRPARRAVTITRLLSRCGLAAVA